MSESLRWSLPFLAAGQAQKEVTHNEAIAAVDRVLHLAVASRRAPEPPATALPGDTYIIGADPVGVWASRPAMVATFDGMGWVITVPRVGCLAWVMDEMQFVVFTASGWSAGGWPAQGLRIGERTVLGAAPVAVAMPEGGTTVDSECRLALSALIAALGAQGVIL